MSEIETPSWVQVGQPVAIYSYNSSPAGANTAAVTKVERFTATQIVTPLGRFRRDTLREVGEGSRDAWSGWSELRPVADPQVIAALAQQKVASAVRKIQAAMRDGAKDTTQARAMLDTISEIVAKTRHALDQIEGPQW